MFGKNFANHLEILADSFRSTSHEYEEKKGFDKYSFFIKPYIKIFGIPEIGFQLRARYFFDTLKKIKKFKPKKILDAGSGIGYYSFLLNKMYPKAEILGIDTATDKLNFCQKYVKKNNLKNIKFQNGDVTKFASGRNKFDLIVNIDVLEHIKDYKKVLKNFYTILSPNGYLYIHTPKDKQKRIFKSFFKNWHHEEHVREGFDPEVLKKDLLKIGFKSVQYWQGFGLWGKLAWELNHITLSKSFILAGAIFPILYLISKFDSLNNSDGLTLIVLAKK